MYLVDTNVVSDAQRRRSQLVSWMRSIDAELVYLSVITLGEIYRGVVSHQSKDPAAAAILSLWFQTLRKNSANEPCLSTKPWRLNGDASPQVVHAASATA